MIARAFAAAAIALAAVGCAAAPAETSASVPAVASRAVAEDLAAALEAGYVFPDTGARYAAHVRSRAAAGAYDGVVEPEALASLLTEDLGAVVVDHHLVVHPPEEPDDADGEAGPARTPPPVLRQVRMIDGEIGYLDLGLMGWEDSDIAAVDAALDDMTAASAIIVDLRNNVGGDLPVADLLFSRMTDESRRLLVMDQRTASIETVGDIFGGGETVRRVDGPDGLTRYEHWTAPAPDADLVEVPVYLLVGPRTVSAAEHLALAMRISGRATLVGEPTRGANHFGASLPLADGYSVFVPVGRTFDPATGEDWEGDGVQPDIRVPADAALDRALAMIRGEDD
ncbi:S41 family peptidase [Marinicauda salina]|nr:S41 family peptidase [Marinicauda salina]